MFVIIYIVGHASLCTNTCQSVSVVIDCFTCKCPGCFADMSFFFARARNQSEKYLIVSLYKGVCFMLMKLFILGCPESGKSPAGRYIAMLPPHNVFTPVRVNVYHVLQEMFQALIRHR